MGWREGGRGGGGRFCVIRLTAGRRKCASLPRCLPNYGGLISISAINCIGIRPTRRTKIFHFDEKGREFLSDTERERESSEFPIRPKKSVINVTNDSCCSPRRKRLFPRGTKSKLALGERGSARQQRRSSRKQSRVFFCSWPSKPMPRATNHKGITRRKKPPSERLYRGYPILSIPRSKRAHLTSFGRGNARGSSRAASNENSTLVATH